TSWIDAERRALVHRSRYSTISPEGGAIVPWSVYPTWRETSCCAFRSDIHEGASVKTGARRVRDFPNIHPASPASAGRHETVSGRSHSRQRRRSAPCRTPGCDLSPALDLDQSSCRPASRPLVLFAAVRRRFMPPAHREASGGPGGEGPPPAVPSPQEGGPQAPPGPPEPGYPAAGLRQFAIATPSSHRVPRFSIAHITRTR